MTGDYLRPAGDHYLVDIAADQNLAVPVGGRHRVVGNCELTRPAFFSQAS